MNYFGTDLKEAGHYFFKLFDNNMCYNWDWLDKPPISYKNIYDKENSKAKGTIRFYKENDYSVCAIEGSCSDGRWNTVTIFFEKGDFTNEEMKEKILSIPIAVKMFDQMKTKMGFEIKWERL